MLVTTVHRPHDLQICRLSCVSLSVLSLATATSEALRIHYDACRVYNVETADLLLELAQLA